MHVRRLGFAWLAAVVIASGCGSCGNANNDNNTNNGTNNNSNNSNNANNVNNLPDAEFGLDERPANTTCLAPATQPLGATVDFEAVFTDHNLVRNIALTQAPNGFWYIATKRGDIREIPSPNSPDLRTWLSIRTLTNDGPIDGGLRGLAFHPDFQRNGFVFVSYYESRGGSQYNIVSRFTANPGGIASLASEKRILEVEQPEDNNNGGDIAFGMDRMLYVGIGDGGGEPADPDGDAQNPNSLLGKILRIDVDGGDPYAVPDDNPFAGGGGAPEVWAWGFQNPHKFSFDSESGALWVADHGFETAEEVSVVEKGGNYGWPNKEGRGCLNVPLCQEGEEIDPIVDYAHSSGDSSVVGGFVYRGTAIPNLAGTYIYGDNTTGKIWGIFYDQWGKPNPQVLLETGIDLVTFGQSNDGEVYFAGFDGGIYRLIDNGSPQGDLPQLLSQTGCVDPDDPTKPASGLIAYAPNAPFWSDNAEKPRYFAIPDGEKIEIAGTGDWVFPPGSVTMKHFKVGGRFIETRFFVRHADESYSGYTYEWNDDESDAVLLASSKVKDVGAQFWEYPSRGACMECHTEAAGGTLGLETRQMDGKFNYFSTNRRANQLNTMIHIGVVDDPGERKNPLVDPFGDGSLDDRARSYLHTNCASCHRSANELGRVDFDVTFDGFLEELCDNPNSAGDLGSSGRLVPGNADASSLYSRTIRRDAYGMPSLGSFAVDDAGADLVKEWIDGLDGCP